MKILHLIYTSGIYGAEKHLLDLLPGLKKYDINCDLLFICPKESVPDLQDYCTEMNEKGINATLLPTTSKMSVLFTAPVIFRYLKSNHIKIVHSHLFSADLIAVLIKKFYFKKLIILSTKHGYEEEYLVQYGVGNKRIRYNLYYFVSKWVNRSIDHNLAVSLALSNLCNFLKLGKNRMSYINHGINKKPLIEKKFQLEGDPKIIMVGRLSEIKGHRYLFNAMPEIIEKFPNIKLYILGVGPLKEKLFKQAKDLKILDHINFVGFANPADYSTQCQVMVVPSLFESFGLVFIESFALKIPVVAFDTEAGNQIIDNNKTGILVRKEDAKELAEKIIYLLQSPDIRNKIIENAFNKYLTNYTAERMAKETAQWYQHVLKS